MVKQSKPDYVQKGRKRDKVMSVTISTGINKDSQEREVAPKKSAYRQAIHIQGKLHAVSKTKLFKNCSEICFHRALTHR